MTTFSIESINQFISGNQLKRVDGNILFTAEVQYFSGNEPHRIVSQVQIIILPNEMAVYILEFLSEQYNITEMYGTGHYSFTCTYSKTLEIRLNNTDMAFLISIKPLN